MRLATSSLAMIRETWTLTVFGDRYSSAPIRLLLCPSRHQPQHLLLPRGQHVGAGAHRAPQADPPGQDGERLAGGPRVEVGGDRAGLLQRRRRAGPVPRRGLRLRQRQRARANGYG